MTPDTPTGAPETVAEVDLPPVLTHSNTDRAQAYARFKEIIEYLQQSLGWEQYKVDTLVHPTDARMGRDRMTVRHHFTAGQWELHYEVDQAWHPGTPPELSVRIVAGRELPSVARAVSELFGPRLRAYDPLPNAAVLVDKVNQVLDGGDGKWHHVNGKKGRSDS